MTSSNARAAGSPRVALIVLIKDVSDDEHGKDFDEIAVSLYAAQLFPSEDNIANFVDRLIAKRLKEKETDNDSEFQDEVESLGALIEDELRDLSVDQRIALASVLANALAAAVIQMHRQHGANREDIVRALAAAAEALSTLNEFRLS